MRRVLRFVALGLGLAVLLVAAGYLLLGMTLRFWLHVYPFMGESFTPEKWATAGSCEGLTDFECSIKESDCPRGPMVRSLRRNHLGPGTGREAVLSLLGPEDFSRDEDGGEGAQCLHWSLGMCSGFGWDYDSLFVCFGKDGHVTDSGHVQH